MSHDEVKISPRIPTLVVQIDIFENLRNVVNVGIFRSLSSVNVVTRAEGMQKVYFLAFSQISFNCFPVLRYYVQQNLKCFSPQLISLVSRWSQQSQAYF